jgi:hypothetical protein
MVRALRLAQARRSLNLMPKRRTDADSRRFFDEFTSVRISRLRASGVIDPAKRQAVISFGDKQKLIGTAHVSFPNGGGYSFFRCPTCDRLAGALYLIDDAPRCIKCCAAMGIAYRTRMGFGRSERRQARDQVLDQLIAKVETNKPLRAQASARELGRQVPAHLQQPQSHEQHVPRLIELRLAQLASEQASSLAKDGETLRTYQPTAEAKQLIDTKPIWRASSTEQLQEALDAAQVTILAALNSDDPQQRITAAKLLLNTKQARERGL